MSETSLDVNLDDEEFIDNRDRTAFRRLVAAMKAGNIASITDDDNRTLMLSVGDHGWYQISPGMMIREFYNGRAGDQVISMLDECDENDLRAIMSSIEARLGWTNAEPGATLDGAAERLLSVIEKLVDR